MAPVTVDTQNILETFNTLKYDLKRKYTITLEFEAYTPVWTGGYNEGRTRATAGEHTIEYGPTPMSIIGIARWLLRSIGPCNPEHGKITHRTCEEAASRAFGSLGNASPVVISVNQANARPIIGHNEIKLLSRAVRIASNIKVDKAKQLCGKTPKPKDKKKYINITYIYSTFKSCKLPS